MFERAKIRLNGKRIKPIDLKSERSFACLRVSSDSKRTADSYEIVIDRQGVSIAYPQNDQASPCPIHLTFGSAGHLEREYESVGKSPPKHELKSRLISWNDADKALKLHDDIELAVSNSLGDLAALIRVSDCGIFVGLVERNGVTDGLGNLSVRYTGLDTRAAAALARDDDAAIRTWLASGDKLGVWPGLSTIFSAEHARAVSSYELATAGSGHHSCLKMLIERDKKCGHIGPGSGDRQGDPMHRMKLILFERQFAEACCATLVRYGNSSGAEKEAADRTLMVLASAFFMPADRPALLNMLDGPRRVFEASGLAAGWALFEPFCLKQIEEQYASHERAQLNAAAEPSKCSSSGSGTI